MKTESREFAMDLLVAMVIEARAEEENRSFTDVFRKFRKSVTFAELYDEETGLWMNGPDYISDEYTAELARKNSRL